MNNDFRTEVYRLLAGKSHIFRSDKERQAIDGTCAAVLSNMDNHGTGPKNRFKIGRKVCYPLTDYLDWLCARTRVG
ncbi:MAG: hypothetical protein WCR46_17955 [Deltaproteobacteria bacterium]